METTERLEPLEPKQPGGKTKTTIIIAVSAVIALLLGAIFWIAFYPDMKGAIPYGVSIENISVSGLTREKASEELGRNARFRIPRTIHLLAADKSFYTELDSLGYKFDIAGAVELAASIGAKEGIFGKISARLSAALFHRNISVGVQYNEKKLGILLAQAALKTNRPPVSARIDWVKLKFYPHTIGRKLDEKTSLDILRRALAAYHGDTITLKVIQAMPKVTSDKLKDIDLKTPLSTFSTKYNERVVGRSKNLKLITDILTGHEIKPGETFSYNAVVGNRTEEAGFFPAPEIRNGKMEVGIGGGACQGSTTVFNAALLGGLDKFDWNPHSMRSHYANPGRDATVYYNQLDLKFTNPFKESVFLYATATKGVMTASMYSKVKLDYKIELSSKWWGTFFPGEKVVVNPKLKPGQRKVVSRGASGMYAALYRTIIYPDGRKVTAQVKSRNRDSLFYPGAKRIVETGPGAAPPEDATN